MEFEAFQGVEHLREGDFWPMDVPQPLTEERRGEDRLPSDTHSSIPNIARSCSSRLPLPCVEEGG